MKGIVFILEFITSVGGVQTVYRNVIPKMTEKFDVIFCDPYNDPFDKEIEAIPGVSSCTINVKVDNKLNWTKSNRIQKCVLLAKNGAEYANILIKVIKQIKEYKADILYVAGKKELLFAYIIKRLIGIPYVYHAHGFNAKEDIGKNYLKWINNASAVIAVSKSVKDILVSAGVKKTNINVVYNGTSLPNETYINESPMNVFRILFVGTIQPKKGLHILIPAVRELLADGEKVELDIAGDDMGIYGDYKKRIILEAGDYYQRGINFKGFITNVGDIIKYYDTLVLPSIEISESFGMVLIEAMANRKPVIGSRIGGIPEVVEDRYCGLLVEPENIQSLKKALKKLINNPEMAKKMGDNGRERVKKMFSTECQGELICGIIDGCL